MSATRRLSFLLFPLLSTSAMESSGVSMHWRNPWALVVTLWCGVCAITHTTFTQVPWKQTKAFIMRVITMIALLC